MGLYWGHFLGVNKLRQILLSNNCVTVFGNQHWYTTGDNYWGSTGTALRQHWGNYWGSHGRGEYWGQHWGSNGTVLKHKSLAMQSKVLLNMPSSPSNSQIRYSSVVREACG